MPKAREVPRWMVEDDEQLAETNAQSFVYIAHSDYRPDTAMQALMEAQPHNDPLVSREERLELRDVIADALDDLTEEERWIFEALYIRKLSLRQLCAEISMPLKTLWTRRNKVLLRLRDKLEVDPQIIEYLEGTR